MRAALAVCGRFQHESSSPCYRSSGGLVDCLRLSESAASCGAASTAETTSSSPGSRYRARAARRSSARSLRFVGRRACTPSGQPGPFQSPCLNRPVDRQAYRSCRPSSSRLPPRQTRPSKSPRRRSPSLYSAQLRTCISSASRACTGCAWDTSWSNIPRPLQEAHFALSQSGATTPLVPLSERHLRTAVTEYVVHYHTERNHQGLGNELITPLPASANDAGPIVSRERLGGTRLEYSLSTRWSSAW